MAGVVVTLADDERQALLDANGTREVLNRLVAKGLAFWVPTSWVTHGGYFLNDKGIAVRAEIIEHEGLRGLA